MRKHKKNVVRQKIGISRAKREKHNKHKAALLWLTGLPCSGKSTLAKHLQKELFKKCVQVYVLDGDNVRHGLNQDLGFSSKDRHENIRRIMEVAKLFVDAGFLVMTSFISPYRADRQRARKLFRKKEFIEIHVDAGLDVCEKRDVKGMYKKARQGKIKSFTGVSAPYEAPRNPELVIKTDQLSIKASVNEVLKFLQRHKYI